MKKIAINGFGRIGRCALRQIIERKDMEVVAINDLGTPLDLAYLFKYDSVHRTSNLKVTYDETSVIVDGKKIKIYNERDPKNLPWKELNIDVVLECTGIFASSDKSKSHIDAGAKKVIISAPSKDDTKTIVFGVNDDILSSGDKIISAASCTTNSLAPIIDLMHKTYGVKKGFASTVHAMTNDQETLDITHPKGIESRRGRAASQNIIPTSTGAAKLIGKIIPELKGCLDGIAFRVPVSDGSLLDITLEIEKNTTKEAINKLFKSNESDTIKITNAPIVSSDIIGNKAGTIIDASLTKIIEKEGNQTVKIVAWYDNETGYTAQMIRILSII